MEAQQTTLTTTGWQPTELADYIAAFRRRRVGMAVAAGAILAVTTLAAALWPPVYTSTATILIEEQEIPAELVRSTITTYAWQRIQTINQRVMTRGTLLEIIDKHGLYADVRRREPTERTLERMRGDIKVAPISADVIDPRTGRATPATIAFTLAFESERPDTAQRVTNELTTLYLNENVKSRTERAEETYTFLTDEANRLNGHIIELETKLARFKEQHADKLPELAGFNLQLVERMERELLDTRTQLRSLEERKFYLEGQLAQMSPTSPMYAPTGERIMDPATRLKMLKTDYAAKAAKYSARHPDVLRMKREIEGLERQVGAVAPDQEQARALVRLRGDLAAAREKYAANHPDIARLEKQIAALESGLAANAPETAVLGERPDNPAYISLQAQLEGINSEMRALERKHQELSAKHGGYERRLALSPRVEKEYLELKRDYDNAQLRYREIKAKQLEAQVGQQLEKERKGERFALIDPPQLPERPTRPNRSMLMLLGIFLATAAGLGYLFAAEALDSSIRSAGGLVAILEATPLSIVPYVENGEDAARRRRLQRLAWRSAMATAVALAILVQFFWLPWDVLWFKGLRVLTGG